jgi:hypothetical protein
VIPTERHVIIPELWRRYNVERFSHLQSAESEVNCRERIDTLATELPTLDFEIVDLWRAGPEVNETHYIDPRFFLLQMNFCEAIRETVLHHLREASQALNDIQLRVMTRATLYVCAVVLIVTVVTLLLSIVGR